MKLIYSNGGFSREFYRCVRDQFPNEDIKYVDDYPRDNTISYEEAKILQQDTEVSFIIGCANATLRKEKTEQVLSDNFSIFSTRAQTAIIGDNVKLGAGAILSDYTIITADTIIGKSFHSNIYSYIGHDCIIGDYVTLAPRVSINGRVEVANNVYIGSGATILPGNIKRPIKVGEGAIIGAHALVTKDVPANTTVVGTPAKPLVRK